MKNTISSKELRLNLSQVLKQIAEQGKRFTVIHRSKVVAELGPSVFGPMPLEDQEHPFNIFLKDHPKFHLKSKKSAVRLVRDVRD